MFSIQSSVFVVFVLSSIVGNAVAVKRMSSRRTVELKGLFVKPLTGLLSKEIAPIPPIAPAPTPGTVLETLFKKSKTSEPDVTPPTKAPVAAATAVPAPVIKDEKSETKKNTPSTAPVISPEDGIVLPSDVSSSESDFPSLSPSDAPSAVPSDVPSALPSDIPSTLPSDVPSDMPSDLPSDMPSDAPSTFPSLSPV